MIRGILEGYENVMCLSSMTVYMDGICGTIRHAYERLVRFHHAQIALTYGNYM